MDCVKAIVDRVVFYNEDNGFIIIKATSDKNESFSIKGSFIYVDKETPIICEGHWSNNSKFGKQFDATSIKIDQLNEIDKISRYLSSGTIKGIGPKTATRIVEYFKEDTLKILDNDIDRLEEVSGIGKNTLEKIKDSWNEKRLSQNIISELLGYSISYNNALKIYSKYKEETLNVLKDTPYQIIYDVAGIGFETIDNIALKMGIEKNDPVRIINGLIYTIKMQEKRLGDTCIDRDILLIESSRILKLNKKNLIDVLDYIAEQENPVITKFNLNNDIMYQTQETNFYENSIVNSLLEKNQTNSKYKVNEKTVSDYLDNQEFPYTEEQRKAIESVFKNKISIITGGPGVGKTTILRAIIDIIYQEHKRNDIIKLASPTGKAAQRMFESTKREAKTIHRLLEYDPEIKGFKKNKYDKLGTSFIVIDEFSMVDLNIFYSLLNAIDDESNLLFIGDIDQLASVGYGAVLRDLIDSDIFNINKLTINNRAEKDQSDMILNAHRINQGKFFKKSEKEDSDFYYIKTKNDDDALEKLNQLVNINIPQKFGYKTSDDIQILTPIHKGTVGTINLNDKFQKVFNKNSISGKTGIEYNKTIYYEGEKVIQTRNNYDKMIFNGDTGKIIQLNDQFLVINFDGKEVEIQKKDLIDISMFYAGTIHKSQGSEFPVVIVVIPDNFMPILDRSNIYTGITRGKKLVIVLGRPETVSLAINNISSRKRKTLLKEKLVTTEKCANIK